MYILYSHEVIEPHPPTYSDLDGAIRAERQAETARAAAHAREASRHAGVAWSGLAPDPFRPRSPLAIAAAAERRIADLAAWRGSTTGEVMSAIAEAQRAAHAAHAAGEAARAALSRGLDEEIGRCETAAAEMAALALAASRAARRARRALREASTLTPRTIPPPS